MKIELNSNNIHEVLNLSKADKVSFVNKGDTNYIIAHGQDDVTFKNQIVRKLCGTGDNGQTTISKDVLKLIPKDTLVTITEDTIIAGERKIKYAPNNLVDEPIQLENYLTTIPGKELDNLLSGYYAMAKTEVRPILNGICINDNEFVALDGFRIAVRRSKFEAKEQVIMDVNLVNILKKIKCEKDVDIYYSYRYVKFVFGDLEVIGNRIEGDYIKYKTIIPEHHTTNTTLKTKPIVNILKDYKKNKFELVKFNFTEDTLIISASNKTASIEDNLCIKLQGEPLEIAFNPNYLIDALNNYEMATLELTNCVSPLVIKENNKLDLVLPVRIRD